MAANHVALEDLPPADEQPIRAHAAEFISMAKGLGLANVRYASDNRLLVKVTDHFERLGPFTFAEEGSFMLGGRFPSCSPYRQHRLLSGGK